MQEPSAEMRLSLLCLGEYARHMDAIFINCAMSYKILTQEKLDDAKKAFNRLLVWHMHFNPDLKRELIGGAANSRFQLEGIAGILDVLQDLLSATITISELTGFPAPKIKPGRLCNSYIESIFSCLRYVMRHSKLSSSNMERAWRHHMTRVYLGMKFLGQQRKDYSEAYRIAALRVRRQVSPV